MSYFYTQSHVEVDPHRGIGKARRASQYVGGGIVSDRDPRLDQEIQKMGAQPNKWNDLTDPSKCKPRPHGQRVLPVPGYTGDNVITEPEQKKRLPRIRAGATEEELRRIWHEDERKHIAQSKMAKAENYVEKMNKHGTSPVNDALEPPVRGIRVMQRGAAPGASQVEPAGLKGVGKQCAGQPRIYGRRAPTDADFAIPPLEMKPRVAGVRMSSRPKDTLQIG